MIHRPNIPNIMSKKKKDKLLLNLLEGERHKHRVAMVTEEDTFNQHEPNSNMARMFVVMLLIHIVVIGGIIVYDFMNGEEAPDTTLTQDFTQPPPSALAATQVDIGLGKDKSLEEYSTYEWKSGDSIPIVAKKLEVSEDVLIRLNKVDQGRQINTNDVIIYPKRPVLKAQRIHVAGEPVDPEVPETSITAAERHINLALPGEKGFSFSATIENELTPTPAVAPGAVIQESPPPAVSQEASGMPVRVELPSTTTIPKVEEAPPAPKSVAKMEIEKPVPKAIPVPRPEPRPTPAVKTPVKKGVETPPPAKKDPVKPALTHVVQSGETFYRIANRYGITVSALQAANKNAKPESLRIGAKLTIPRK